jgi:hypothetical protein
MTIEKKNNYGVPIGRAIRYNLFLPQRQAKKGFPLLSLTLILNAAQ